MRSLLLLIAASSVAFAGCGCGGYHPHPPPYYPVYEDCLQKCRDCGPIENLDATAKTDPFKIGELVQGDCKELICLDKDAQLVVDDRKALRMVCYQSRWYPQWSDDKSIDLPGSGADAAKCVKLNTDCPLGASPEFNALYESICVCKAPYDDVSSLFDGQTDPSPICSSCKDQEIKLTLLLDTSGSLFEKKASIVSFAQNIIKFFQTDFAGTKPNKIAIVTASYSFEILCGFNAPVCSNEAALLAALEGCKPKFRFTSDLAAGLNAVKSALVQPQDGTKKNVLVVITDGGSTTPICKREVTHASEKLKQLNVATYAVGTSQEAENHYGAIFRILTGGDSSKIFFPKAAATDLDFETAFRLQHAICPTTVPETTK